MIEKELMDKTRMAVQALGARLFRNNNGVAEAGGRKIRFGLGKGTSDLIGWVPVKVTDYMVGQTIAVFVAAEGKQGSGRLTPEQAAFQSTVKRAGGIAIEFSDPEDAGKKIACEADLIRFML